MTIGEDGYVGGNYSAQLPELLGHSDIAGKGFDELILSRSGLSEDDSDRAWQSILASIDEHSINFEANLENFPKLFAYRHGDRDVMFRLTWNVEADDFDNVQRLLVTILDATAEVEAQKNLDAKNEEFEIIKQLIEIGAKKAAQFFNSGDQLIEENERLIASGEINVDIVKILFVNMHTLKGAARTLHLTKL